ncbi:lipopolysaccharide biosynthesis protein [Granulicella tundricola]|uniref:Polysaccharide biosynthesis protein n=1 Tax=Granulicella tundricola (strain ATCC BAA-1859 / DSM 23138 / MP5ACTX9) TaxID=1198114 RepID=E8X270_GRATM|nr:polysaccharide biosynthesis C-terminal domain-containing protein [Granulicella tundricola]ADW70313.1 polysaccharide biosynthesis protein [Granulicella tundricola MP5ACTX9]
MTKGLREDIEIVAAASGENPGAGPDSGVASRFTKNSLISVGRLFVSTAVALILPSYLTHKLPIKTYSAWILVMQMSAYVGYLDFGVQTGISKYVAEYEARNDAAGASMRASAGLAIMLVASALGVLLTLVLAWRVPDIFHEMPSSLYKDVRISLVLVGVSLSLGLLCSICSAIFMGLQRFSVPMAISLVNRFLFTGAVFAAVFFHSSLALMGGAVAGVNLLTGGLQVIAWRRMANNIRLTLRGLDRDVLKNMIAYCSSLAIWTAGMLCVSGLDVTIVGRYDFSHTAFYSIATLPTNFMLSIMGAAVGPLMPTASALSVHRTAQEMGAMLSKVTRYSSTLLVLAGLPLLVAGYWVLRLWVGSEYALHTIGYLRILVLANVIRNLCLPYSSMLVATEKQKVAIIGASAEAIVNLGCSLYLVKHIGALGVAYGTLLGSLVSVGMHFALSMRYTYERFSVTRMRLFLSGMIRPLAIGLPSLVLFKQWWVDAPPVLSLPMWALWGTSTLLLAWFASLNGDERSRLSKLVVKRAGLV